MRKLLTTFLVFALLANWNGFASAMSTPVVEATLTPIEAVAEAVAAIRPDCSSPGADPCYTSLAAWEADYGGIDFGAHAPGDLVATGYRAIARIEGVWTLPDTSALDLSGWVTDAGHDIYIYTAPEARHTGIPASGYRLAPTGSEGETIFSDVAYFRIEGLEIQASPASSSHLIYLRPDTAEGVGEIHFSHNLIHGNGASTASGIYNYTLGGTLKIWNNIIYDVGTPGYTAGIQTGAGTAYLYNNTIVSIISGFAIRAGGKVIAANNITNAPGEDFYGSFYPGSDFNASSDDSAPGLNSRRSQTFTFVDRAAEDFHLLPSDAAARNYGNDLSGDPNLAISDDVDNQARAGGWDIGADETVSGADLISPVRLNGGPSGTLPATTTGAQLSLSTNEVATCRYAETPGIEYSAMPVVFSATGGLTHEHELSGLHDEQDYTYYVRCQDPSGNANNDDFAIIFSIASSDAIPPVISGDQVAESTPYSAVITWATDEPATSQVEYGLSQALGELTVISATRSLSHSVTLLGLDPAVTYHFRVRSKDIAGNEAVSAIQAFTTPGLTGPTYYVNQKHSQASDTNLGTLDQPWLTIQHAADVAQPGDTIIVYPGQYGRTVIGQGGNPGQYITFIGLNLPDQSLVDLEAVFDPQSPVQTPANPAVNAVTRGFDLAPPYPLETPVSYVRIENFEITAIYVAGEANGRGGIRLGNTRSVLIVRNFLHDLNPDPDGYDYIGIRGDSHQNHEAVIKANTLYRVQGTGISIVGQDWVVDDNELSHGLDANTDSGAHVGGDSDAMRFFGSGHIIRNNFMHDYLDEEQYGDPHIDCFQTFSVYPDSQFAHDILIDGNTCDRFGQMLMIEDSSEENGTGDAVHHITFRNNVFRRARAYAIQGGGADYFTFVNNVVAESQYGAFGLSNNPYLTVANNIFYNNSSGSQINDEASKVGSVWDYNLHYPDFDWPHKQPAYDLHSLFGVEPGFVNAEGGNYHLQASSPAIDRGVPQAGFNYDKDAILRPQMLAWDIGAYESVPDVFLQGMPADQAVYLQWSPNITLPLTTTWQIAYDGPQGTEASPIVGLPAATRAYTLTGLTNYAWYTITLSAMFDQAPFLNDTIRVMPSDHRLYLPLLAHRP